MIRIDLAPHPIQETTDVSPLTHIPWKSVGILLSVFCVGSSVVLGVFNQLQARTLRQLSSDWQTLQPRIKQLEATEAAIRALANRAKVHQMLKAPEAQWAPRLNLLSDGIVSQLWFTSLRFETVKPEKSVAVAVPPSEGSRKKPGKSSPKSSEKTKVEEKLSSTPALVLVGSALVASTGGGSPVSRYLQRLKAQPAFSQWFREVELKSVQQRQVQQEPVSDFVITLYPTGQ